MKRLIAISLFCLILLAVLLRVYLVSLSQEGIAAFKEQNYDLASKKLDLPSKFNLGSSRIYFVDSIFCGSQANGDELTRKYLHKYFENDCYQRVYFLAKLVGSGKCGHKSLENAPELQSILRLQEPFDQISQMNDESIIKHFVKYCH